MTSFGISIWKFWLLTFVIAVVGFVLWKPLVLNNAPDTATDPHGAVLVGFIAETAFSSLAMGFGISLLVFGGRVVSALPESARRSGRVVQLSLVWLTAPWLIHEGLHVTNGDGRWSRLLGIEFGFHLTSYIAAALAAFAAARIVSVITAAPTRAASTSS